ncbi:hypothetical protein ACLOJK_028004 [Asimina triloba]
MKSPTALSAWDSAVRRVTLRCRSDHRVNPSLSGSEVRKRPPEIPSTTPVLTQHRPYLLDKNARAISGLTTPPRPSTMVSSLYKTLPSPAPWIPHKMVTVTLTPFSATTFLPPSRRMFPPPQPVIACVRAHQSNRTASCSAAAATAQRPSTLYSSAKLASSASLYDVLGLSAGASSNEIKAAYRKLARSCHPDVVAMDRKDTSADEFMKIHAAYSTLSDPAKRADYDRTLLVVSSPSGWQSRASASRFGRRTWETDQCW